MRIADETQEVIEYSQQLKQKVGRARSHRERAARRQRAVAPARPAKGRFPQPGQPRGAPPAGVDPLLLRILMDNRDLDPSQLRRFARIIHGESERMTRLLDEILDLSLLERGETTWALEPVDAATVLQRAIEASAGLASHASVRLVADQRVPEAIVEADADRLSQVFLNLISNAIKYNTSNDPHVRITSQITDDHYEITIEDNGPGIGPRDRERIFEKFSRAWSQKPSDRSGTGLGLAISWQIVHRLGGKLELLPATATGAKFRVSLPILHPARSPHAVRERPSTCTSARDPVRASPAEPSRGDP